MSERRNHVPPPGSALAPNTAPGRLFWDNNKAGEVDHLPPPTGAIVDLTKPNLTRISIADQLYGVFLNAGQDPVTARANADAQALLMIP